MAGIELQEMFRQLSQQRRLRRVRKPRIPDTPTSKLVRGIRDADVVDAVRVGVSGGPLDVKDAKYFGVITRNIDWDSAQEHLPKWFNIAGFVRLVTEVSMVGDLQKPLESVSHEEQRSVLNFLDKPSLDQGIAKLKEANSRVAGTAILNALLGAVMGDDIHKVIDRKEIAEGLKHRIFHKKSLAYDVALEIGSRFGGVVGNPEELFVRMQSLIPDPDNPLPRTDPTLQELFLKKNTFDTHYSRGILRCPAIHVTSMMLQEWGRQLGTNTRYKERFIKTITKVPVKG